MMFDDALGLYQLIAYGIVRYSLCVKVKLASIILIYILMMAKQDTFRMYAST